MTGATGYRVACSWYIGFNSWNKCGKDSSNGWQVYGTSAGTTGVTIQYIDGSTTDANTGAWVRLPFADDYAITVQAVKDGTPGNWSTAFDAYPAFPIEWMRNWHPGFGIAEQYQGLDASVRTATGFTLAWTHPYRAAGYVAECVELVDGQVSGSWTTCKKDVNVFSEKTVNGNAVTVAQAHLYGTTANDRVITGIAIDDLDLDTTGHAGSLSRKVLRCQGEDAQSVGQVRYHLRAVVHNGAVLGLVAGGHQRRCDLSNADHL